MKLRHTDGLVKMEVIGPDGVDRGYTTYGKGWWSNPDCPFRHRYLDLDSVYPPGYFEANRGHPTQEQAQQLHDYMQETYVAVLGRPFRSVLELGCGGGEITKAFKDAGLNYFAVAGTTAGAAKLAALGVPPERVTQADLRFVQGASFEKTDLVMCTEVAEHLEPSFAAHLVGVCVRRLPPAVWFSAARGDGEAHYHHANEQPIEYWDNLFALFGYDRFVELDRRFGRADRLYIAAYVQTVPEDSVPG